MQAKCTTALTAVLPSPGLMVARFTIGRTVALRSGGSTATRSIGEDMAGQPSDVARAVARCLLEQAHFCCCSESRGRLLVLKVMSIFV